MLIAAGCTTFSTATTPQLASITQTEEGNAYRTRLQPGTLLFFATEEDARQFRGIAYNETAAPVGSTVEITRPLDISSPAYWSAWTAREIRDKERILQLEDQLDNR